MTGKKLTSLILIIFLKYGLFVKSSYCQDVILNLNTKKIVATTSDKFLSLTIDPAILLNGDVLTSSTELTTNMAKAFAPGYVRLAGPKSNFYTFERSLFPKNHYHDPDLTFSEAHWVLVQQWAQKAGLEIIASLALQRIENNDQTSTWDPKNSLELISFSDHMGYNISWELGYECQTRVDVTGFDLGKDVVVLKNILNNFPRYSNSIVAGPDIVSFRGKMQQQFIQDYLNAAGNSLSVITWHPDFAGIASDSDGVALQRDTLAMDRDSLYKSMGRSASRKPLWIAESKPEECKQQFLGALVWARRLGNAAKLGVQVIMRQPDASSMFQPTPDFWVSFLHKTLVGKEVLDAKLTSGNKTNVHFYCQCTKASAKYDRGSITIFGINLTPGKISVSLKGLKIKTLHKYILMPGFDNENRMFAETVLLNDKPLTLLNGKNLPEINPAVTLMGKHMAVKLPSGGIGFWVIPGARVKSCLGHDDEIGDKSLLLKKLTKKLEEQEIIDDNNGHEYETDNQQDNNEAESVEDIKSLLKSKKKKVMSKYRHGEIEPEDEDRRFKRIDAKREFERLEKLLKRNNNNNKDDKNIVEKEENKNEDEEEEKEEDEEFGVIRLKENENGDSGEEIRNKLEEYQNKLSKYESRKKNRDYNQRFDKTYKKSTPNDVDVQKAVEAVALISKFDGIAKSIENVKDDDKKIGNFDDADIGEEMLIQELEKSDKIKRMIEQKPFGKIYEFFVGNNRDKLNRRSRRDLEKLFGEDPLGLRKDGLFKKRAKIDDVKERRLERRNRKKDREDIGLKKELPIVRLDARNTDSSENNFYGFPQMKPVDNFPVGDLYLSEGSSSEEKSHDYDYVKDDDDDDGGGDKRTRKRNNKHRSSKSKRQNKQIQDETWIEDANSNINQMPNEFFEKFDLPKIAIKTQWKDYTELYEPESAQAKDINEDSKQLVNNTLATDSVIIKARPDDREDKRAKETAVKKLLNYYDNSDIVEIEVPEYKKDKQIPKLKINGKFKAAESQIHKKLTPNRKPEDITREENMKKLFDVNNNNKNNNDDRYNEDNSEDPGSMEFVNSKAVDDDYSDELYNDDEVALKKRSKRKTKNLNDRAFGQEMINEDANNLKDCKCRVIRSSGKVDFENCAIRRSRREVDEAGASRGSSSSPAVLIEDKLEKNVEEQNTGILEDEESSKSEENKSVSLNDDAVTKEIESEESDEETKIDLLSETTTSLGNIEVLTETDKPAVEKLNTKISEEAADKHVEEDKQRVDEAEDIVEDVHSKRDVSLVSTEDSEDLVGASSKIVVGTGSSLGTSSSSLSSSSPVDLVESKLKKNAFDLKLKSEEKSALIKSDLAAKNKLSLKAETIAEMIKEKELKKAEVIKALETSSKLKSVDNTKYVEYQKKQAEKLATLKEKLRERKAKILQQYRNELLEALNKCDTEVERNLKRREICNRFNNQEELQEFIDKDKVAYLMMNRPINYDDIEYHDEDEEDEEDRRYYPQVEIIQPLRSQRERKIPVKENRGYFYWPKTEGGNSNEDNESYYALVESLETPKIFGKKQFDNLQENKYKSKNDYDEYFEKPHYVVDGPGDNENRRSADSWDYLIPEYHDGIIHHRKYSSLGSRKNRDLKNDETKEYRDDEIVEIPLEDGLKILQKLASPCSDGKCGGKKSFADAKELEESIGYQESDYFDEEEPIIAVKQSENSSVRKQREVKEKPSGYVCLKEDSSEDSGEIENRIFKLVKNDDHYEAVPISKQIDEPVLERDRKIIRRVVRNGEKVRNKRRKYSSDLSIEEDAANYYRKNVNKYVQKNGDQTNNIEAEKYEILMLIPVEKKKSRRQRRDLNNNIERSESNEDANNVSSNEVDLKDGEKRLKEYVDAKQKTYNNFKEAQANLASYLKKLRSMHDPRQIEEFDRFVLNLGSDDHPRIIDDANWVDETEKYLLGEYLKKDILQMVHEGIDKSIESPAETIIKNEKNPFDDEMPELKSKMDKNVGKLSESLEIPKNEFDDKFEDTSSLEDEVINNENDNSNNNDNNKNKNEKISYNLFHDALNAVKNFFNFLTGTAVIFG